MLEENGTITRKDWMLIVLAAGGKAFTPAQLQKTLFLLGQEHSRAVGPDFYEFEKYDYGPYTAEIYRDAEEMEEEGLVRISPSPNYRWKEYAASKHGLQRAKALRERIDPSVAQSIDETVSWTTTVSFQELVAEVYERYPEYRENSIFQDQP